MILCGVQGAGKTTLYRDRFVETHVRVAMDLLRTRAREEAFLRLCLEQRQRFVVDTTNPTAADARRYVEPAREAGFRVDRLPRRGRRRRRRSRATRRAPGAGAYRPRRCVGTGRRLLRPTPEEGFDELWHATAAPDGGWRIEPLLTRRRSRF